MPGNKHQLFVADAVATPGQVVRELGWLIIFVNAEKADIEIEPGIFEIIRITAVESNLLFRREHQAHIRVLLKAIKMILAAAIKGHDIAAQPGLFLRLLFDGGHHGAARGEGFIGLQITFDRRVHLFRHIFDAYKNVQLQIQAALFLGQRLCVESILQIVVGGVAELVQRVGADMVIREDETVLGNKFSGTAAVEPHRTLLQVLQPFILHVEVVLLLQLLARRLVVEPHPLVGANREIARQSEGRCDENCLVRLNV